MKFFGLDLRGKFWIQRLPDIADNPWTEDDIGRLVFNEEDEILYYGSNDSWIQSTQSTHTFNINQQCIFCSYPLPDGWNIVSDTDDRCIRITNSGSQVGVMGGNWQFQQVIDGQTQEIMTYAGSHDHYTPDQMGWADSDRRRGTSEAWADCAIEEHQHVISYDGSHRHTFDGSWRFPNVKFAIGEYEG